MGSVRICSVAFDAVFRTPCGFQYLDKRLHMLLSGFYIDFVNGNFDFCSGKAMSRRAASQAHSILRANHGVRFYTGTPAADKSPMWHGYWAKRLLAMRRAGILVTSRSIRYREEEIQLSDGSIHTVETPQEKGIDLRIGLDVVRMARGNQLDVAVIFSQDQDLAEVARDIREIARSDQRWIKIVSAFPSGPNATSDRGIDMTDWFKMDQTFYDACLDPRDYRPPRG